LQGFGRAWLAAGARGTIGTLWAVPDSDGEFFKNFYRQLRGGASPASALRASQIRAIEEGGSRSLPKYWAAYTMIGKD
jgi:CHAT domain-containing protein